MSSNTTHWGKLYGSLFLHPKWAATPAEGRALWTSALSYCIVIGSDGDVPESVVHMLNAPGADASASVDQLLSSGLWVRSETGYKFHDWEAHQQTVAERKNLRAKRSEAGKASAEARQKAKSEQGGSTSSTLVATHVEQEGNTVATEKRREEKRREETTDGAYTPEFETFWKAYPRKKEKKPAWKAWRSAVKRVSPEVATAAAQAYARDCRGTEEKWIKLGSTWLNADAWNDYPAPTTVQTSAGVTVPEWSKDECDEILGGPDYWSCPRPPEGLSIPEEMAWKRERVAEHLNERRMKAWEVTQGA